MIRLHDKAGVVDLGFGGAPVRPDHPAAAYATPATLGWLQAPVAVSDPDRYQQDLTAWRVAGLVEVDGHDHHADIDEGRQVEAEARALTTGRLVLVVASSRQCGFCDQLEADVAANFRTAAPLPGSGVLVKDGECTVWGTSLPPGGERAARARTDAEAETVLRQVLAVFASPGPGQVSVLAGAVVRRESGTALLFPRSWRSFLVKRASRLTRFGWRVCPDPFLRLSAGAGGKPVLAMPSLTARDRAVTVQGVMLDRPQNPHGATGADRARLLAQIIIWAARPTTLDDLRTLAGMTTSLPLHLGSEEDAMAFLATASTRHRT